jgi:hypothetical protein
MTLEILQKNKFLVFHLYLLHGNYPQPKKRTVRIKIEGVFELTVCNSEQGGCRVIDGIAAINVSQNRRQWSLTGGRDAV